VVSGVAIRFILGILSRFWTQHGRLRGVTGIYTLPRECALRARGARAKANAASTGPPVIPSGAIGGRAGRDARFVDRLLYSISAIAFGPIERLVCVAQQQI